MLKTIVNSRAISEAIRSTPNNWALEDAFLQDLGQNGVGVITDTDASTPADILCVARLLGTTDLGVAAEMSGPLVMDIRYDGAKTVAGQRPSYFSCEKFPVHTDMSYVPSPPRFLLTQCVRPSNGFKGATLLADCSLAWAALPPDSRTILSEEMFTFAYPPNCDEGHTEPLAICPATDRTRRWRFRSDGMIYPPEAVDAVAHFREALDATTIAHRLQPGDLLVVENTRVAHGRTAFSGVGTSERHLRRVYARDLHDDG
jgi:alpha-ketoglutarate-dependent taurine dioxygenase